MKGSPQILHLIGDKSENHFIELFATRTFQVPSRKLPKKTTNILLLDSLLNNKRRHSLDHSAKKEKQPEPFGLFL